MVVVTSAPRPQVSDASHWPAPSSTSNATNVSAPTATEGTSWRRRFAGVARRQASSGPTPVRASSGSAMNTRIPLNIFGPNSNSLPTMKVENFGKIVRKKTTARMLMNSQLLMTKLASRETIDSSLLVARRAFQRHASAAAKPTTTSSTYHENSTPKISVCAKACTDVTSPLRVIIVPNRHSE